MPCSDDDRLVYSIKELPEVFSVEPIDLFVVETLNGTSIVSFDNIVFDLNQTTFEETFNKHTTDIDALSASLNNTVTREIPSFEFRQAANISGSTNLNWFWESKKDFLWIFSGKGALISTTSEI